MKEISVHGDAREGAHIYQKIAAGPFGSTVKADMDVIAYWPPNSAFLVTTGPLRPRIDFLFTPVGDDGTEVPSRSTPHCLA